MVLNTGVRPVLMTIILSLTTFIFSGATMAYEEPRYSIVERNDSFELRDYEPYLVAEVEVYGPFEDVGNEAFGVLFDYISGKNAPKTKVAMTVPVTQQTTRRAGDRLAITTPVLTTTPAQDGAGYRFSFIMPAALTSETVPKPVDTRIRVREVPAKLMAARRYSGRWSESNYRKNEAVLMDAIKKRGLKVADSPVYARYNSPFSLWFLRRNEVLVEISR